MILSNFYRILETFSKGKDNGASTTLVKMDGTTVNCRWSSGREYYIYDILYFSQLSSHSNSLTTSGIAFGTGTTPPTFNDYKLSGELITNLSVSNTVSKNQDGNGTIEFTTVSLITNNNATDVTIGEVAYVHMNQSCYPTSTSIITGYYMCERTVLDTPVTIPAGGIGQVTYTIRMNYPTA